jgi:hypothetical protein
MKTAEQRFWEKVDKNGSNGCWIWTGNTKHSEGYGRILVFGKRMKAHRFSWQLAHGSLPSELDVCHTCDNPACVNPMHLFLGTHKENMQDKALKCRALHDERHPMAKLTRPQVIEILSLCDKGHTRVALSKKFHVSEAAISAIANGKSWKHIFDQTPAEIKTLEKNNDAKLYPAAVAIHSSCGS